MASKARSDVWQHFEKLDAKTVKCKMCSATLVYNSTTSSMHYHLAHKHKKADDADATTSSQTSIRDFTIRQKCDKGRAEKMTQLIAEMTAEDLLPISFVEGEGITLSPTILSHRAEWSLQGLMLYTKNALVH